MSMDPSQQGTPPPGSAPPAGLGAPVGGPLAAPPPPGPPAGAPAYGAPVAAAGPSGPRASFGQRLGAYLVDVVILIIPLLLLALALKGVGYAIGIIVGIGYFVYFEGGPTGQTVGKKALNIRVIDFKTGGPIGYGRAFLRYIGRLLSTFPFVIPFLYLGYLWMLWDREKQTWHDKLATTVVVPTSAYPVTSQGPVPGSGGSAFGA